MSTALHIRPARPGDETIIRQLIDELAEYEQLAHEAIASDELLRQALFSERPDAEVILAELEGEVCGFALFFHNFSTFLGRRGLYLEDLYVRSAYRGQGVGIGLLKRLAQIAIDRGCGRMEWMVLNWNQPAIKFYHGLGANPLDEWTTFRLTGDALEKLAR
ncbi:MAG: GNAT family N-acetyltransferase [Wenzhouxiangellaceae bacterium]